MRENLVSGSTLLRNSDCALLGKNVSDSAWKWVHNRPTRFGSGCHHQACFYSEAPVGKGVGHLSRALAPLRASAFAYLAGSCWNTNHRETCCHLGVFSGRKTREKCICKLK